VSAFTPEGSVTRLTGLFRLHDAQREDVVTFLFQIWLFFLALVTVFIPYISSRLWPDLSTGPKRINPAPDRCSPRTRPGLCVGYLPRSVDGRPDEHVPERDCSRSVWWGRFVGNLVGG